MHELQVFDGCDVEAILGANPESAAFIDADGRNALMHAVSAKPFNFAAFEATVRRLDSLRLLPSQLAHADTSGWTTLHIAASRCHTTPKEGEARDLLETRGLHACLAALLLEYKALDANLIASQNRSGRTALHYAASRKSSKAVEMLCSEAEAAGLLEKLLLATDSLGETALHRVASLGDAKVARMLVSFEQRLVQVKNRTGAMAADLAREAGHLELASFLQ